VLSHLKRRCSKDVALSHSFPIFALVTIVRNTTCCPDAYLALSSLYSSFLPCCSEVVSTLCPLLRCCNVPLFSEKSVHPQCVKTNSRMRNKLTLPLTFCRLQYFRVSSTAFYFADPAFAFDTEGVDTQDLCLLCFFTNPCHVPPYSVERPNLTFAWFSPCV